jgi:hypothetical protein
MAGSLVRWPGVLRATAGHEDPRAQLVHFQPGSSERHGDADAQLAELILARVPSVATSR